MKKNKVNELYSQSKTRSFVLHLVRAYLPIVKVNKILATTNNNMSCCICGKKLTVLENNESQAFTGENTKTYMCTHCINQLNEFVQAKVATNDKQINFALQKEMAKDFPELLESIEKLQAEQKADYERKKTLKQTKISKNSLLNFIDEETKIKLGISNGSKNRNT